MNYQYLSKSRISWLTWTNQNLNVPADHAPSHCYKYQTPLLGKFIVHEVSFLVVLLQKVSSFLFFNSPPLSPPSPHVIITFSGF